MVIIRLLIVGILVALRLWGADSEMIKVASLIGLVITGYSLLFTLCKGRKRKVKFSIFLLSGIIGGVVWTVGFIFWKSTHGGIDFPLLWTVALCAIPFAGAVIIWRVVKKKPVHVITGILLAGSLSVLAFSLVGYASASLTEAKIPESIPTVHFQIK